MRTLLTIDADALRLEGLYAIAQERLERANRVATQLTIALDAAEAQRAVLERERTRLADLYETTHQQLMEAQYAPDIGEVFAWALAGLFGVATVVLGLVVGLAL